MATKPTPNSREPGTQKPRPQPRPAPAPQQGTKPDPGERMPEVGAFLTPEDQFELGEAQAEFAQEIGSAELDANQLAAQLPQTLAEIQQSAQTGRSGTNTDAIERGIFGSSIRDIQIADINAAETISTDAAKNLVANAQSTLEQVRNDIETNRRPALMARAAWRAQQNQREANEDRGWIREPSEGTPGQQQRAQGKPQPGRRGGPRAGQGPGRPQGQRPQGQQRPAGRSNYSRPPAARRPAPAGSSQPGGPGRGGLRPQPNRPGGIRNAAGRNAQPRRRGR